MDTMKMYENLKAKVVERKEPFDRFIEMLETETDWLTGPAGTSGHSSQECALLKHSVSVATRMLSTRYELASSVSEESCVITGLFHDIGKVGMPGVTLYLPNDNEREVENGIIYRLNTDVVPMDLALRGLYLATRYLPLSGVEAQAIAYDDRQNDDRNKEPLAHLMNWADQRTAHIYEEGKKVRNDTHYYPNSFKKKIA